MSRMQRTKGARIEGQYILFSQPQVFPEGIRMRGCGMDSLPIRPGRETEQRTVEVSPFPEVGLHH